MPRAQKHMQINEGCFAVATLYGAEEQQTSASVYFFPSVVLELCHFYKEGFILTFHGLIPNPPLALPLYLHVAMC